MRSWLAAGLVGFLVVIRGATLGALAPCIGDCNGDGTVRIGELIAGVNVTLGNLPASACEAFDCWADHGLPITCAVAAVRNALSGCRVSDPPATPTATLAPFECRHEIDCTAGFGLCLEPGGFAGCGICYPDLVIDEDFVRCDTDTDCAVGVCEPLGFETRTCTACSGSALVCMAGCAFDDECASGTQCDRRRCVPQRCSSDAPCPPHFACLPTGDGRGGICTRSACSIDQDCSDGFCVKGLCYDALGQCTPIPE